MYFETAAYVGLIPSTRAHARIRSGFFFRKRISLSRSQTLSDPVPPNGVLGISTVSSPSMSAGSVNGSSPTSSGFSNMIVCESRAAAPARSSTPGPGCTFASFAPASPSPDDPHPATDPTIATPTRKTDIARHMV
jgi:hypothetical protein